MPTNEERREVVGRLRNFGYEMGRASASLDTDNGVFQCEKCGDVFPKTLSYKLLIGGRSTYHSREVRFCPRCGAKVARNCEDGAKVVKDED